MVAEEQAPPTETVDEEPTETGVSDDGDGDAGESPSIDDLLERFKPEEVTSHPSIQAAIAAEVQKAEDRTRNRMVAESRRRYGDPKVVGDNARAILKESGIDDLTRSQEDRLNTLIATFEQQAASKVASEIPGVFFKSYKLPQDTLETYQDHIAAGDYDSAFQALIDGAVSLKTSSLEGDFEKRVKVAAKELAKAELNAGGGTSGTQLPSTSRGSAASRIEQSLTTAEIEKMPYSRWKALPDEVKQTITANVATADRERGAQTVDMARLERLASLAK